MPDRSPDGVGLERHWTLDPEVTFLNHGSFGACPDPVLEAQQRWRTRLERQPVRFLARELEGLLDEARVPLARFLGADPQDLAWVSNATTGVNAVVRSLGFRPGDEIVHTDHGYEACGNAIERVAAERGARVAVARVPFPLRAEDEIVEPVLAALSAKTRLVVLDHVTSPTALVFPVTRLARELGARGVPLLVDGAHAPGMLDVDVPATGAAYYTGNCHKWLCAPKGAAFLWVRRDLQPGVRPLVTSHGASSLRTDRSRFLLEFDWVGTDDPTAALSVPAALEFLGTLLPGGWPELRARNHALAIEARKLVCEALDVEPPCPESMLGSMAAIPLPPLDRTAFQARLLERHGVEIPVTEWPRGQAIRLSCQAYNRREQYERLAAALTQAL